MSGASARLALFYAAIFTGVGFHMPYWPVFLSSRGLDPTQIGWLMALTFLARIVSNTTMGAVVDRRGDRRRPLIALGIGATAGMSLFAVADGFWAMAAITLGAMGCWSAMMPLGDNLTMITAHRHGLDYGRIRLWGSLAFIGAASLGGQVMGLLPPETFLWLVVGSLLLTTLSCLPLPDVEAGAEAGQPKPPLSQLLTNGPFLLFLAAAALNQISHQIYYGFATLEWRAAGLSGGLIGGLWAEGVVAEILLFAFSGLVVRRLGPTRLLLLAGLGGVVRWTVLGITSEPAALLAVNWLHALTFGCSHLGAMHFIQQAVPTSLSARAQGLYSSVAIGLAMGVTMPASGWLYETLGRQAFLGMTLMSAACVLLVLLLARRWSGGALGLQQTPGQTG